MYFNLYGIETTGFLFFLIKKSSVKNQQQRNKFPRNNKYK